MRSLSKRRSACLPTTQFTSTAARWVTTTVSSGTQDVRQRSSSERALGTRQMRMPDELSQDSIDHLLDLARRLVRRPDDLIQAGTWQRVSSERRLLRLNNPLRVKASDNELLRGVSSVNGS
jgi:hypothetical protein